MTDEITLTREQAEALLLGGIYDGRGEDRPELLLNSKEEGERFEAARDALLEQLKPAVVESTPGPWKVFVKLGEEPRRVSVEGPPKTAGKNKKIVARIGSEWDDGNDEEDAANARLICAAPRMFVWIKQYLASATPKYEELDAIVASIEGEE